MCELRLQINQGNAIRLFSLCYRAIMENSLKYMFFSLLFVSAVFGQIPQRFTAQNPCTSKGTCQECIQTPSCAWCYDPVSCFFPAFNLFNNFMYSSVKLFVMLTAIYGQRKMFPALLPPCIQRGTV